MLPVEGRATDFFWSNFNPIATSFNNPKSVLVVIIELALSLLTV
jgi:hypothetical protein